MESMETPPRLRLEFEDRKVLSRSQKSSGLKRSWLLLKPQFHTISDLSSHLIHIFHLHRSCPNGILLSMDGFVLPPFESTSILKDKDIICVKKKVSKLSEIINVGDGVKLIEEVEIVDKQPVLTNVPLLANEEFEKEIGGYQSEEEDDEDHQETLPAENSTVKDAASKKRKAAKNLPSPKRKKRRSMASEAVEVDVAKEKVENAHTKRVLPVKRLHKKKKVSERKNKPDIASTPEKAAENNENVDPMTSSKRCGQFQENGTCDLDVPEKPDGTKKTPSRSARRKKAKRQWLRELTKAEKQELVERRIAEGERRKKAAAAKKGLMTACDLNVPQLNEKRSVAEEKPKKSVPKKGLMALFPDRSSDVEDEVIPVVIRPGHIRFEPLGDKVVQQIQVPVETFKSNGNDNKKKGQKRGREKFPSSRRNDHRDVNKDDHRDVDKDDHRDVDKECSDMVAVEKEATVYVPIDFDKLAPLTSSLKEGDVIAYRLVELSSDWTPELSSFRVGKTSFYDPESNKVALKPVSGYPVIFQNADGDTFSQPPDNSIYKEDGSLEIDFTSLVDLRIVEHEKLVSAKAVSGVVNGGPAATKDATPGTALQNNDKETFAPTPEKHVNAWDEISKSLSAKKAELSQEKDWTQLNSGRSSSSYRAPRGRALGPTMALLRARNDI